MTTLGSVGTISSSGIGSGLDVEGIVTKLMSIEQRPLTALKDAASSIQTKISAFGSLQSAESSFRDAARALANPTTWSASTGTSSDPASVGVVAKAGAVNGSYAVAVQSLASAQSIASTFYADPTAVVGAGTLHISVGSWAGSPATFTAQADKTAVDVVISDTDTLADVRDKINAADAGVTASIVTDQSGSRLVVTARATGAANGFRIGVGDADGNDLDGAGLSALAYDPSAGTSASSLTQAGADAELTVNGLAIRSASNTLTDIVEGLTLSLSKTTSAPVQIGISQDSASIRKAIEAFVTAYNDLATKLGSATKYDTTTKVAGALQGDSTAVSLQRQLRNMISGSNGASSVFTTLSQVGLEMQQDGTLKINDSRLTAALGDMGELKRLFSNADTAGNGANDGIAVRLRKFGDEVLGADGMLTTRAAGLSSSLASNTRDQDKLNDRLANTEARLRAQYAALDTKMATLNALSTYMTQQIAAWNKKTSD